MYMKMWIEGRAPFLFKKIGVENLVCLQIMWVYIINMMNIIKNQVNFSGNTFNMFDWVGVPWWVWVWLLILLSILLFSLISRYS